jgi:hypothetical protein
MARPKKERRFARALSRPVGFELVDTSSRVPIASDLKVGPSPELSRNCGDDLGPVRSTARGGRLPEGTRGKLAEFQNLMTWVKRETPEFFQALRASYASGEGALRALLIGTYHQIAADLSISRIPIGSLLDREHKAVCSDRLDDVEREHIRRVLAQSKSMGEAARSLGINSSTLWRKRKRYHLLAPLTRREA